MRNQNGKMFMLAAGLAFLVGATGSGLAEPIPPGDFNGDGTVDQHDLHLLAGALSGRANLPANADASGDAAVDSADIVTAQLLQGPTPTPSPSPTAAPSPSPSPTVEPSPSPTATPEPTASPTATPTASPTPAPTATPGIAGFVVFNDDGGSSYRITSQSNVSPEIYSGSFPVSDPTLTLQAGSRYRFTTVNSGSHPLQIIAKGQSSSTDTILLTQGGSLGSLEGDAGIGWTDTLGFSNGVVEFTLTPTLATAMQGDGSQDPGYRCAIHSGAMRGGIVIP